MQSRFLPFRKVLQRNLTLDGVHRRSPGAGVSTSVVVLMHSLWASCAADVQWCHQHALFPQGGCGGVSQGQSVLPGDSLLLLSETTSGCVCSNTLEKAYTGLCRPSLCPIGPHAKAQHCMFTGWLGTSRSSTELNPPSLLAFSC